MAVKLDVSNSIINAYAQGKAEAVQAEELRKKQEQTQIENDQRQKQIDAQRKQFEDRLKFDKTSQDATHAHEKAVLDLQHLVANQGFADAAEKTGNLPAGFNQTGQEEYEISPGVMGTRNIATDASGNTFRYRTPESTATQNANITSIERKPLMDEARQQAIFKEELARETDKLSADEKMQGELRLKTIEEAAENSRQRIENLNRLEIARISAGARNSAKEDNQDNKSYTYHNNLLEKQSAPIDTSMKEIASLQRDLLGMGTLQADKLVAPQLLKILVGGTGSGVRITQGEIAQVAGGQTGVDSIKALLNKFVSSDQSKAIQILPEQRKAINAIVDSLVKRTRAKQLEISKAGDVIRSEGITDQERKDALNSLEKNLRAIDEGDISTDKNPNALPGGFILNK